MHEASCLAVGRHCKLPVQPSPSAARTLPLRHAHRRTAPFHPHLTTPFCLQLSGSLEVGTGDGPAAARLLVVLRERPYSAQVQAEERGSPLALALVALAGAL